MTFYVTNKEEVPGEGGFDDSTRVTVVEKDSDRYWFVVTKRGSDMIVLVGDEDISDEEMDEILALAAQARKELES